MSNSLKRVWLDLKQEHGIENAARYITDYYVDNGVVFAASWSEDQKVQVVMTFMESLMGAGQGIRNAVTVAGKTTNEEVKDVFDALAASRPVTVPEHFLVYSLPKDRKKKKNRHRSR